MVSASRQALYRAVSALRVGVVVTFVVSFGIGGVGALAAFIWHGASSSLLDGRGSGVDPVTAFAVGSAIPAVVGLIAAPISAVRAYRYEFTAPAARSLPVTRFVRAVPGGDDE